MSSRSVMSLGVLAAAGLLFGTGCGDDGTAGSPDAQGATENTADTGTKSAPATVAGTWSGQLQSGASSVGVRFVIEDQGGQLSGQTFFEDPVTLEFLEDAELTGTLDGASASWTTSTDLVVVGEFDGKEFSGTMEFPPDGDRPPHTTNVSLSQ